MPLKLRKSNRVGKKWVIKEGGDGGETKRTIHFGQKGARDFTLINNKNSEFYIPDRAEREKIKKAYQTRHRKDNLDNPYSPGALSWYLLWTAPTLRGEIKNYEKRFKIDIKII